LARRILQFVDEDISLGGAGGFVPGSVAQSSQMSHGNGNNAGGPQSVTGSMVSGREHEELRRSVREAFASGR
jgi:hypothetical protein